eukprot:TRINITY_DN25918_c0_g1_i1.p1 TRINITY_DN25918_c0_g1~~TRINITY_DN25918_c0_g1_i1.p1  ORF type:complete len:412 (+),score=48.25 TRINITY_DN25918_c0_g1_i1:109-1344(+)
MEVCTAEVVGVRSDASVLRGKRSSKVLAPVKTDNVAPGRASQKSVFSMASSLAAPLPSHVESSLLRATPLAEVLSGFGKHFQGTSTKEGDYELSLPMGKIDDFLSHDWGTPRWSKLLALLFIYNNQRACVASASLALPLASLGAWLDRLHFAKMFCPAIWLLVLLFGQSLWRAAVGSRYVFLDKLCIHQTDPAKKAQGILGLAGFLRASERLVVLWSPRYFTRLWCAYELAAWAYIHGDKKEVYFVPIMRAQALLLFTSIIMVQYFVGATLAYNTDGPILIFYVMHLVVAVVAFPLVTVLVFLVRSVKKIHQEVEVYDLKTSMCFCCTHQHTHPVSGAHMPCDRKLVYTTLVGWSARMSHHESNHTAGSSADRSLLSSSFEAWDAAVDTFNDEVRRNPAVCDQRRLLCLLV